MLHPIVNLCNGSTISAVKSGEDNSICGFRMHYEDAAKIACKLLSLEMSHEACANVSEEIEVYLVE